jgi:uncharacterized membrane protein
MMSLGMGFWMLLGGLVLVVAVVALVLGSTWLVGELARPNRSPSEVAVTATQVLHSRYAAGEIDDEELAHRLAQIKR